MKLLALKLLLFGLTFTTPISDENNSTAQKEIRLFLNYQQAGYTGSFQVGTPSQNIRALLYINNPDSTLCVKGECPLGKYVFSDSESFIRTSESGDRFAVGSGTDVVTLDGSLALEKVPVKLVQSLDPRFQIFNSFGLNPFASEGDQSQDLFTAMIQQKVLPKNIMSFDLFPTGTASKVIFGGIEEARIDGQKLNYTPLSFKEEKKEWAIGVTGVGFDGKIKIPPQKASFSLSLKSHVPDAVADEIYSRIGARKIEGVNPQYVVNCSKIPKIKKLRLKIPGINFRILLDISAYSDFGYAKFNGANLDIPECFLNIFTQMNHPYEWNLGLQFFTNHYVTFDYDNRRIGIGRRV